MMADNVRQAFKHASAREKLSKRIEESVLLRYAPYDTALPAVQEEITYQAATPAPENNDNESVMTNGKSAHYFLLFSVYTSIRDVLGRTNTWDNGRRDTQTRNPPSG